MFDWLKKAPATPEPAKKSVKRHFLAAKVDRMNSQFTTQAEPIDHDIYNQGQILLARARYLAQNNEYVKRYLKIVRNNVIGSTGIRLQVRKMRGAKLDGVVNTATELAFKDWGRKKNAPEVTAQLSWHAIESMTAVGYARDGECFIVKNQTNAGLRLQLIDPMLVPHEYNRVLKNGNTVVMGIELNALRRPVAYYHMVPLNHLPHAGQTFRFGSGKLIRIPADRVIHIKNVEYVGQTRGFTPMAAAVSRLNQLQRYDEAIITAARVGASNMLFYIDGPDGTSYAGDVEDEDDPYEYVEDVEPGIGRRLPQGTSIEQFDPKQPTTSYSEFNKSILRGASSALNISYHTLAQDLESVNFSSARTATLEDREEWKELQAFFAEELHEEVYDAWLPLALLGGKIKVKGQPLGVHREGELKTIHWQAKRWAWVDPLKDIQASQIAAGLGVSSVSEIIREDGRDPDEVFEEIAAERKRFKTLGIDPIFKNGMQQNEQQEKTDDSGIDAEDA